MFITHTQKRIQRHTAAIQDKLGFTKFGEVPVIGLLVGIAGGILSLIVMFALVPVIGESVDQAMPHVTTDNPNYNAATYNAAVADETKVSGTDYGTDDIYGHWYKSGNDKVYQYNGSEWTDDSIPTGVELWQTIGPLLVLCALVAVVMIVLKLIGVF